MTFLCRGISLHLIEASYDPRVFDRALAFSYSN